MQNQNQILSPMPSINQMPQTPKPAPQQFSKKSTIIIIASAIVVAAIIIAATIVILNIQKTPPDDQKPGGADGTVKEINEFNEKDNKDMFYLSAFIPYWPCACRTALA